MKLYEILKKEMKFNEIQWKFNEKKENEGEKNIR